MHKFDVVVIGSGFGGAIAAYRLAKDAKDANQSISICILERGQKFEKSSFPQRGDADDSFLFPALKLAQAVWSTARRNYGPIDYRSFDTINVVQGSGLGGGSLHYFGGSVRAPSGVFVKHWPTSITRLVLELFWFSVKWSFVPSLLVS